MATAEMANAAYQITTASRCFPLQGRADGTLEPVVTAEGATVNYQGQPRRSRRPPPRAGRRRPRRRLPLVKAGFTKRDVRAASRALGLRTWDKPAAACLASRLPYGTPVSTPVLRRVAEAEAALGALGFRALRVRHYDDTARLEVPLDDLAAVLDRRETVVAAVHRAGYRYVTLDLEGLRSGNLNAALGER
ncbi:MAG: hypothetical protein H6518_14055 [Microthrixaceae bacterium]|nr:hypothetical protein [Microthrixaceae bacterium]